MTFSIGQTVYWLHGDHHRVATVIDIQHGRVKLSGLTSDYWISAKKLQSKIDASYPSGQRG